MQILVLGMHRSGTSLITRLINLMGAYIAPADKLLPANKDNPKGFWERTDVMRINQELMRHFGCTWYRVDHWNDEKLNTLPEQFLRPIPPVIAELNQHSVWVLKDPRLCITLPCWLSYLQKPVAVIAYRDPLEIANSLELRNGMPVEYGLALWEYHAAGIIRHAHVLNKVWVSFDDLFADPAGCAKILADSLKLPMPARQDILDFVEPKLRRAKKGAPHHTLSVHQQKLAAMLQSKIPFEPRMQPSLEAQRIMQIIGGKITGAPL